MLENSAVAVQCESEIDRVREREREEGGSVEHYCIKCTLEFKAESSTNCSLAVLGRCYLESIFLSL